MKAVLVIIPQQILYELLQDCIGMLQVNVLEINRVDEENKNFIGTATYQESSNTCIQIHLFLYFFLTFPWWKVHTEK